VGGCSFCGRDEAEVVRLFEGGPEGAPRVRICDGCVNICWAVVYDEARLDALPDYELLRDWHRIVVDGVTYRWSAVRKIVKRRDAQGNVIEKEPTINLLIGMVDCPAVQVEYPDGTEPTEALAIRAIRGLQRDVQVSPARGWPGT